MSKSLVATLCVLVLAVLVTCGCATTNKGSSDQELVKARVDEFWAGATAHDIDRVMACVSDSNLSNKAALKEVLKTMWPAGTSEKDQVDMSKARITIKNDTAIAGPVCFGGEPGHVLVLKKEEAGAKPAADRKEEAGEKPKFDWFITDIVNKEQEKQKALLDEFWAEAKPAADRKEEVDKKPELDGFITDTVNKDEKLVRARVDEFWAGLAAHDIERVMACVSENFNSSGGRCSSKAVLKEILKAQWGPGGASENVQVDTSKAGITIKNDTATAMPFWLPGCGCMLTLKKEEAVAKPPADGKEEAGKKPKLDWFITDMIFAGGN